MSSLDSVRLSEESVRCTAHELISKYGSHAWGMADVRVRALKSEGFHSFAATWERIREAIETDLLKAGGVNKSVSVNEPNRFISTFKWGGCLTALVFAVGGLLMEVVSPSNAYGSLSQGMWIIVAISMAVGFAGVVLDRSSETPE